ncbi:GNAT family N-acetyltransferase [Cellulosimicrobium arenosum]|uniref:GNAT family N-acetyltransferase n=1 Tax=Cellulosimicrobium arenosum TaxID=2708133 RepID=A0A927J2D9_9MICO|nr:GNAT family N-acetyltransferase [Cellulosimicrobium arenosum]MBD8080593.1 GNAT family N-acetyltransferase [Cellulosimicrobium arenosum]
MSHDRPPEPTTPGVTADRLPPRYAFTDLQVEDLRAVLELDGTVFPSPVEVDELVDRPLPLTWPRTLGVVHEVPDPAAEPVDGAVPVLRDLVALHSSYPFSRFPVPGGVAPVAGLTWVAVHPGHRRQGILTAMIHTHLARCRERGEPLSALFAAEAAIYGRFGYGRAADDLRVTLPRGARLRDVPGAARHTVRIERADRERHGDLVADLHRRVGDDPTGHGGVVNRPGWAARETPELQAMFWDDAKVFRKDREPTRIVVVELDGEPRGYARFHRTLSWEPSGPRGSVRTGEVVALDAAAARALWGVLTDLDLTHEVVPFVLPVDDAVTHLLVDPRSATPRIADNLWVRVVDVADALTARRYAADVDVVLHVTDELLGDNTGRWRVRGDAFGPAVAHRTDDAADLSLDVRELGAAYLGGTSLAALGAAGFVAEHTPGALARASAAFSWPVAPVCGWVF